MRTIEELAALDSRETMTWEEEHAFVDYCFNLYEAEGFAKVFCSPYEADEARNGMPYKVLGRVKVYEGGDFTNDEADLECLPMWMIQFEDGHIMNAYPEEIIPSEIHANLWYESQEAYLDAS